MSNSCDLDQILRVVIAVKNNQPIEIRKKGLEHWTSPLNPTMLNFDEFEYRVVGGLMPHDIYMWRLKTPFGSVLGIPFTTEYEANIINKMIAARDGSRDAELVRFVEVGFVDKKELVECKSI